jgi:S-methylmethionine-dependent homocysteine/selenocysteine methylase
MSDTKQPLPIIIDGGMGTELKPYIDPVDYTTLWSAAAFCTPDGESAIVRAHIAFLQAGANLILTNSYACTQEMLGKRTLNHLQSQWIKRACELAHTAAFHFSDRNICIGGSIPPLRSSYRPDLVLDNDKMREEYEVIVQSLIEGDVDILVCETMSCIREATVAATTARRFAPTKPVWVSVTLQDELLPNGQTVLRSGETLDEFVSALESQVDAFLLNCCLPEVATVAIATLTSLTSKPIGVYANRFKAIPHGWCLDNPSCEGGLLPRRTDLNPEQYAAYARQWLTMGASIVGGCCGITPDHIRAVAKEVLVSRVFQ